MKRFFIGLFMLGFVITVSNNVFAQTEEKKGTEGKRVIEEQLVLKDPTVAAEKKWTIGGSFEYWYMIGPYNRYDSAGTMTATGNISGDMPGGNIFVGYDNFTVQYSYRPGEFDVDSTYLGSGIKTSEKQKAKDSEITLRYLFRGKKISPYVIVGYSDISIKSRNEIKTPGAVWSYNGKTVSEHEQTYKSFLAGVGLIVPVYKEFGLRGDIRGAFTKTEEERDDGRRITGSGIGFGGTLTGYLNISKGLNLQAGFRGLRLNGGDATWYKRYGSFASLGYTHRF